MEMKESGKDEFIRINKYTLVFMLDNDNHDELQRRIAFNIRNKWKTILGCNSIEQLFISQRITNHIKLLLLTLSSILALSSLALFIIGYQYFYDNENDFVYHYSNQNENGFAAHVQNNTNINLSAFIGILAALAILVSISLIISLCLKINLKPLFYHGLSSLLIIIGYISVVIVASSSNEIMYNAYGVSLWISSLTAIVSLGLHSKFIFVFILTSTSHIIALACHADGTYTIEVKPRVICIALDLVACFISCILLGAAYKTEYMERESFLRTYAYNNKIAKLEQELELAAQDANNNELLLEIERGKSDIFALSSNNDSSLSSSATTAGSSLQWPTIQPALKKRYHNIEILQPQIILQNLLLDYSKIKITGHVGSGSFGEVYQATFQEEFSNQRTSISSKANNIGNNNNNTRAGMKFFSYRSNNPTLSNERNHDRAILMKQNQVVGEITVAVKRMSANRITRKNVSSMLQEIIIQSLCDHPNIVKVFGWIENPFPCIVLEYMEHGSLDNWLNNPLSQLNVGWCSKKLRLAIDAASGITYLHARGILHRDIKAMNFLINSQGILKISDFGSARPFHKGNIVEKLSQDVGTAIYVAPEVVSNEDGQYNEKADVWSFGLVLCEILTHTIPYSNPPGPFLSDVNDAGSIVNDENEFCKSFFNLIQVIENKINPLIQLQRYFTTEVNGVIYQYNDIPNSIIDIIGDCVSFEPEKRPEMKEVLFRLFEAATLKNDKYYSDPSQLNQSLIMSHLSHPEYENLSGFDQSMRMNDPLSKPKRITSDICSSRKKTKIDISKSILKTPSNLLSERTPHRSIWIDMSDDENHPISNAGEEKFSNRRKLEYS